MKTSVFDNPNFFSSYMELRKDLNYNDMLEHPRMTALLPPLKGKSVIDLGCGYGSYSLDFIARGAIRYLGIDSSDKMIEKAQKEASGEDIEFRKYSLEYLGDIKERFDLAYSSLVFHYIEDFKKLSDDIYSILNKDGVLLFSQMHPIISSSYGYSGYFDQDYFAFTAYPEEGRREGRWFKEKIISYHRKVSTIINTLVSAGFLIECIEEPVPSEEELREFATLERDLIRPTFLIIKARKN